MLVFFFVNSFVDCVSFVFFGEDELSRERLSAGFFQ